VRPAEFDTKLPLYRTLDFGFVNPFVCLWIQVGEDGAVRVLQEYQQSRKTILANTERIMGLTPCNESAVAATFCDPAGNQHSDISGTNCTEEMRRAGVRVQSCKSSILEGVEKIRKALKDGAGNSQLVIDPSCRVLIKSFETYHYPDNSPSELPVKDGISDHHIDALRYFFVNYEKNLRAARRRY
jgi:phage terminase large subunit